MGEASMRKGIVVLVSGLAALGPLAGAAQAACTNNDIVGKWTWEVSGYSDISGENRLYTIVCRIQIAATRKVTSSVCTQVDITTVGGDGTVTTAQPFTVTPSCVIRNRAMQVFYEFPGEGGITWSIDKFEGWMSRDKGAFTAVLSDSMSNFIPVKVSATRR
jgi:hypothetical protein